MSTTAKSAAIAARKLKNDSFSAIKTYLSTEKETNLLKWLNEKEIKQVQITYEFIRYGAKEEDFFKHLKDGSRNGKKFTFSLNWAFNCLSAAKMKFDKFGAANYNHFCEEQKKLKVINTDQPKDLNEFIASNRKPAKVTETKGSETKGSKDTKKVKINTVKPMIPTSKKTGKKLKKIEAIKEDQKIAS